MTAYGVSLVQWVAATHLSVYLRTLTWVWPLCETLHFVGLAVVVGIAGFFDLRLLGCWKRVPVSACKEFMPWAIAGFALNLGSGLIFLIIFPAQYVYSQAWWLKVLFLFIAGANALFFETAMGARMVALKPGGFAGRVQGHRRDLDRLVVLCPVFRSDAAVPGLGVLGRVASISPRTRRWVYNRRTATFSLVPALSREARR